MTLATQADVEFLARRIERAYILRGPQWNPGCSAAGVWEAAAATLLQAHHDHPSVPVDPELFVAAQSLQPTLVDPWAELAQSISARRYCRRVRRMIAALRIELRSEIRRALRRIHGGESVTTVLLSRCRSLSPLGRYIVAHRSDRMDIAEKLRSEVERQHASCPLYRQASRGLLPPESYPVPDAQKDGGGADTTPSRRSRAPWS